MKTAGLIASALWIGLALSGTRAHASGGTDQGVKSAAVLPLSIKGAVDKSVASVLDDLVLAALQAEIGKDVRITGQSDIEATLGFERKRDLLGCDAVSCAVDIAGALGVDSIIYGNLGALGKKRVLSLVWLDQRSSKIINRTSETLGDSEETYDLGVKSAVLNLLGRKPAPTANGAAAPTSPKPVVNLTGTWRFTCCSNKYWGKVSVTQTGARIGGGFIDSSNNSTGQIEGEVIANEVRFSRQVTPSCGQYYVLTLSADQQTLDGSFSGCSDTSVGREFRMTRE